MKRPSEEQLRALSQEELIELFYAMFDRFEQKIAELQAKIDELKRRPTTSKNSSQPPWRDFKSDETATPTPQRRSAGHATGTRRARADAAGDGGAAGPSD